MADDASTQAGKPTLEGGDKGVVSSNIASGSGSAGAAGTATPTVIHQGFSQKDLDKYAGTARDEGRTLALKEKANELGFASVEEMEAAIAEHKQAEDAKRSQAEKLEKELEAERKKLATFEGSNAELLAASQKLALNSEAKLKALELGVPAEWAADLIALTDFSEVKVGDVKNGFAVDADALGKALEASLEKRPMFLNGAPASGAQQQRPANIGTSSNPGGPAPEANTSVNDMSDEEFATLKQRVLFGEKVSLK